MTRRQYSTLENYIHMSPTLCAPILANDNNATPYIAVRDEREGTTMPFDQQVGGRKRMSATAGRVRAP